MDGLDWMTVAEVVPITAALAVIGLLGSLPPAAIVVSLALCGAMIGFAYFNRPVAKLFLGDVGSLPIGLIARLAPDFARGQWRPRRGDPAAALLSRRLDHHTRSAARSTARRFGERIARIFISAPPTAAFP